MGNWFGFGKSPPPVISRKHAMKGIPRILPGITSEKGPTGERIVFVPRVNLIYPFLRRFMPNGMPKAKVILDEMGNAVWELIDGSKSVKEIVRQFSRSRNIHEREAEASVAAFLEMLMKRGMVGIAVRQTPPQK